MHITRTGLQALQGLVGLDRLSKKFSRVFFRDFTGATFRGVKGLDTAITTGARGLPR